MSTKTPHLIGLAFLITTLGSTIPAVGLLNALAMTLGAAALGLMSVAISISTRQPIIEKIFGPLDKAYAIHQKIGLAAVAAIIAHVIFTIIARDISPLHADTVTGPVIPLAVMGVVGLLSLIAVAATGMNKRLAYDRFQKLHGPLAGIAFVIVSIHSLVAISLGPVKALAPTIWSLLFVALGVICLIQRVLSRRPKQKHTVSAVESRERAVEIFWPNEKPSAHQPGQFVVVSMEADGKLQRHPFTLTNDAASTTRSVLVRAAGDWTALVQDSAKAGDLLSIEGPFGNFLPGSTAGPEIWIAGGSGITPFLSALRTAIACKDDIHAPVHLIVAAASDTDAPCWAEIQRMPDSLPWLTVESAFSDAGARLTSDELDALATSTAATHNWFVCGPGGLVDSAEKAYSRAKGEPSGFHTETYNWR